ncbi:MAG: 30S ribosome-binding factor RbfA [Erysipelotrichaceae bacterium]|jgi:ribosome-binding factor A|nr:30S ribosome-binding factor RbfA [Erysipelotrichaceae bacterium]
MSVKSERIATTIKRILSETLQQKTKDKDIGFVTITDVRVSSDISYAKVYVTFLDHSEKRLAALQKAGGFLRSELASQMDLFKVPQLSFILDDSLQKGNRIDQILDQQKNRQ